MNQPYHNFVEIQQGLDVMKFNEFEEKTLECYSQRVSHAPEKSNHILAAADIIDVLDKAFAI